MNAIWNREIECMPRARMEALQLDKLQRMVSYCYDKVPFYKRRFDAIGLRPSHIRTLSDISLIPFTTKDDLRDNYPFDLFAVPQRDIVRLHASSGTTGKPIVVGYTKGDMEAWTEGLARLVTAAGASAEDTAQICFGYGMFTGGFGLHYGLERVGATVIPASSGNSERQMLYLQDFGTTVLVCTPSYALYLAEIADEMEIDRSRLKLRLGLFGGEGHTPEMRREIETRWGILATENYGLSEITGPGVSGECTEQAGMHVNEDLFYPEVVDRDTLEPLGYGAEGELVLTTLSKEGIPMLRYRTKDITELNPEVCRCGRHSVRMKKIKGRTDDMLIIRGVNVFPSQIESVLVGMAHIGPHYQIVVSREGHMDKIEVHVELLDETLLEHYRELEKLESDIRHRMRTVLQVDAKIKLVNPKSLERTAGKSKRVLDMRHAAPV